MNRIENLNLCRNGEMKLICDRISFFKIMNLSDEINSKYKNIEFSEGEAIKLGELLKTYKLEENFNFAALKRICDSEIFLNDNIMMTLILCLIEKTDYSFLKLFNEKISEESFANNEFKKQIFLSMEKMEALQLMLEDILAYCQTIFEEVNDITFYQKLSQFVNDELFEDIRNEFDLKPKREMNYLVIFSLQNRNKLYEFIEQFQMDDFEETLFLIQACFEISKTDKEFPYGIIRDKLICKVDRYCNERDLLIGNYLNLLFMLFLENDDEFIAEEINKISDGLGELNIESVIQLVYREKRIIGNKCAECLYSLIIQLSDEKIEHLKYPISHIYSLLEDSIFVKFCMPILSIIGIEESKLVFSRIENNPEIILNKLLQTTLKMNEYFDVAIKVIKLLYKKKKISSENFEENYFLRLLRIFHCYELDADFICNISIDLFLNASNENNKKELYDYILTSIYDNYFYLLQEKVEYRVMTEHKLKELNLELIERCKLHEKSRVNLDFKPSEKNMNIYYEKEAERNRKIKEDAEKLSVFYQLFSRQTILYGNKVQYKHIDDDGNLHMQVSEMKKMSHSMPIPVRFLNDPLFHKTETAIILEDKLHD
ncbi:hypothetical protein P7G42_08830 [Enterococcus faecalis]|uniref:hypothetical protein n=1 Tax=Enterococcus faecalis TaxID=1351 RepID=UPI00224289BC|nr:hypothetical protein [Enterococcus faecalis]MDT2052331.1 hypothetical protein [Enterococcus faecalis]WDA18244.1 hypothetical protein PSC77_13040 [Enterococcus faecalis]